MPRVFLSQAAFDDLLRLQEFLAESEDPMACELLDFIFDALHVLTHQPGIGRPVEGGLRELLATHEAGAGRRGVLDVVTLQLFVEDVPQPRTVTVRALNALSGSTARGPTTYTAGQLCAVRAQSSLAPTQARATPPPRAYAVPASPAPPSRQCRRPLRGS